MPAPPNLSLVAPDGPPRPPLTERSDEDLMAVAGAGGRAAFAVLAARYMARVASYCAKLTGDRHAAEELAQEVFLALWAGRTSYRPERPFATFLFTVATNRCRNHRRWARLRFHARLDDAAAHEVAVTDGDQLDAVLDAERRRRVHAAIAALSPRLREAVLLRFEQGLDHGAIAAIVGRPEATIRTRVFAGVRRLRATLGEEPW